MCGLNNMDTSSLYTYGNEALLRLPKTAFLCSRHYSASVVLPAYNWAIVQRTQGRCVISGFHSPIEQDVLHYLLQGTQPVIVALARGLKQRIAPEFQTAIDAQRLLIVAPFPPTVTRITAQTAQRRNQVMAELADEICVAYAAPGGQLERLMRAPSVQGKRIRALSRPLSDGFCAV